MTSFRGNDPATRGANWYKVAHCAKKGGADKALHDLTHPRAGVYREPRIRRYNSAHPDTMKLLADHGAALSFSDCPPVPGMQILPHEALRFTVGPNGALDVRYLPASENE